MIALMWASGKVEHRRISVPLYDVRRDGEVEISVKPQAFHQWFTVMPFLSMPNVARFRRIGVTDCFREIPAS